MEIGGRRRDAGRSSGVGLAGLPRAQSPPFLWFQVRFNKSRI
ncbi:hypothetical protein HanIR_Chr02g0056531 [Helianthus annuus]|nr:hypothetical protein HanIR_Chr02g0056531 [Helianthus annuus]